jgi:hypothetical protein
MKITAIKSFVCNARMRNWVFVKVETDQPGLVGWGGGKRIFGVQVDGGASDRRARGNEARVGCRAGRRAHARSRRSGDRHHGRLSCPTLAGDGSVVREIEQPHPVQGFVRRARLRNRPGGHHTLRRPIGREKDRGAGVGDW